jgi:hypothetical protein
MSLTGEGDLFMLLLMTMHTFNFARLLETVAAARAAIPCCTQVAVNIGDVDGCRPANWPPPGSAARTTSAGWARAWTPRLIRPPANGRCARSSAPACSGTPAASRGPEHTLDELGEPQRGVENELHVLPSPINWAIVDSPSVLPPPP